MAVINSWCEFFNKDGDTRRNTRTSSSTSLLLQCYSLFSYCSFKHIGCWTLYLISSSSGTTVHWRYENLFWLSTDPGWLDFVFIYNPADKLTTTLCFSIKGWWQAHHFITTVCTAILLIWYLTIHIWSYFKFNIFPLVSGRTHKLIKFLDSNLSGSHSI